MSISYDDVGADLRRIQISGRLDMPGTDSVSAKLAARLATLVVLPSAAFAEVTTLVAAAIPSSRVEWVEGGHLIDPAHPAVLAFVDDVLAES